MIPHLAARAATIRMSMVLCARRRAPANSQEFCTCPGCSCRARSSRRRCSTGSPNRVAASSSSSCETRRRRRVAFVPAHSFFPYSLDYSGRASRSPNSIESFLFLSITRVFWIQVGLQKSDQFTLSGAEALLILERALGVVVTPARSCSSSSSDDLLYGAPVRIDSARGHRLCGTSTSMRGAKCSRS
jgi:hypothetical protein